LADDIAEINEIFDKDPNFNPMINKVFHDCVRDRFWKEVPVEMDAKIKGWNWKLKNTQKGYVEILSEEPLTQQELDIMADETEGQITDGYNENPFEFNLSNGHRYSILFDWHPTKGFAEE
jgi:hypothetical protein